MEQILVSILEYKQTYMWILQFLMMALVSMIPFAPIPILATIIATNHTFTIGLAINLAGTVTGSILLFWLSKSFLRKLAQKSLQKRNYLKNYLELISSNGFLAILIGRIVPIMPSAVVNLIAGISGVRFFEFTSATILGKLPTILPSL